MKSFFTFFCSLLLATALFAADRPNTYLSVKMNDYANIVIVVNGREYRSNDNNWQITHLNPGKHQIRIYKEKRFGLAKVLGIKYDLVFNRNVFLKPQTNYAIFIDPFGQVKTAEFDIKNNRYGKKNRDDNRYDDDDDDYNRYDGNKGHNRRYDDDDKDYNRYGKTNGRNNFEAISDYEFARLYCSLSRERSDARKYEILKAIASDNYLNCNQLVRFLNVLNFDNQKTDIAEIAYRRIVDKNNFDIVYNSFYTIGCKEDLQKRISRQ